MSAKSVIVDREKDVFETFDFGVVTYEVILSMEQYIASPYWSEMNELIDIEKKSGTNRARSEQRKEESLLAYLKKEEITPDEFARLKMKAKRPFYRVNDEDQTSEIVLPRHQLAGCLVQACKTAPAGTRFRPDDLRSKLRLSDFTTGKFEADTQFKRFVKSDLTNQRRYQVDEVISNFAARGTVVFNPSIVKPNAVKGLIQYAVCFIGVGSARKMAYGRGNLIGFKELK